MWEATADMTHDKEVPLSCIEMRTRSHTEETRMINLSQILNEGLDTTSEEGFVMVGQKIKDSPNLPNLDPEWVNKEIWCQSLKNINESISKAYKTLNEVKRDAEILEYRNKGAEAVITCKDDEIEILEPNRVSFIEDQPAFSEAMVEIIQQLEDMGKLSLDTAPKKRVTNILNFIIALCIEYNALSQKAQKTISTMSSN